MYSHISKWTMPRDYFGAEWPEYYSSGVGRSRDSDALERANFDAMLTALRKVENKSTDRDEPTVQVVRESHWAVGWVEWIAIHESDTAALECANDLMRLMEGYPVIDEELYSRYENEECSEVWMSCFNTSERAEYLRKRVYSVDAWPGYSVYSMLRAAVKGSWDAASCMLPDPSALLR